MDELTVPVSELAKSALREQIGRILRTTREATSESTGAPTADGASPLPPQVDEEEEIVNA
tara:strand:- start:1331 stop:1510 length:180 start_codon:yes stop_codon:yes gene_type:complete